MNELALYAGSGGGILAGKLLGWKTVCYVERNEYCIRNLIARIKDGYLDDAPIWDEARTFDGRPWAGLVGVVTAGFPCQPFAAGGKRLGADDERNGWPDTIRIVREVRPKWVFLENSIKLLSPFRERGEVAYFGQILGDLAAAGYDARWTGLSAGQLGFDHERDRVWIVAHTSLERWPQPLRINIRRQPTSDGINSSKTLDTLSDRISRHEQSIGEPGIFGIPNELPHRVERLAAVGQAQVPTVAAMAWKVLSGI